MNFIFYKTLETYFDQIWKKKATSLLSRHQPASYMTYMHVLLSPLMYLIWSCNCFCLVVGQATWKGPFRTNEKSWAEDVSRYARQWGWHTLLFKDFFSSLSTFTSSYSVSWAHAMLIFSTCSLCCLNCFFIH
jgi:hypothetical protein